MVALSKEIKARLDRLEQSRDSQDRPKSRLELDAYARQIDDLRNGHKRGLAWDEYEAQRAVKVFELLRHPKGKHAGKPFKLETWQEELIVAPLFGWFWGETRDKGGRRRFRRAYIEMPRKNGKTALAAGLIHKLALFDNEPGAEVYCLAGSADQARTLFDTFVKGMISEEMIEHYQIFDRSIFCPEVGGRIKLLSSKHGTAHSFDPHGFVLDEVHVQPDRMLWDAMTSGQGARENPMAIGISTAGHDRSSICWHLHEDVRKTLAPNDPKEDDALFGFIATIDEGDDWREESSWKKANPNYGITVQKAFYEDEVSVAIHSPGKANSFRQLNLDEWTQQAVRWIDMDFWDSCQDDDLGEEYLKSLPCYLGFDLGSHRDLSSLTMTFRDEEKDRYIWKSISWAPEESTSDRADRDRSFVKNWIREKKLRGMPGTETDLEILASDISDIFSTYQVEGFAFDPGGPVKALFQILADDYGIDLLAGEGIGWEFYQSHRNFNPVMREFERMLSRGQFVHDGDFVLRWQATNLSVKANHKDEIMCDKSKSADKIDAIVAGFMGLALAYERDESPPPPVYRGALSL